MILSRGWRVPSVLSGKDWNVHLATTDIHVHSGCVLSSPASRLLAQSTIHTLSSRKTKSETVHTRERQSLITSIHNSANTSPMIKTHTCTVWCRQGKRPNDPGNTHSSPHSAIPVCLVQSLLKSLPDADSKHKDRKDKLMRHKDWFSQCANKKQNKQNCKPSWPSQEEQQRVLCCLPGVLLVVILNTSSLNTDLHFIPWSV